MLRRGVLVWLLQISTGLISVSCLVRELTSPRVVYPRVAGSASCRVTVGPTGKITDNLFRSYCSDTRTHTEMDCARWTSKVLGDSSNSGVERNKSRLRKLPLEYMCMELTCRIRIESGQKIDGSGLSDG